MNPRHVLLCLSLGLLPLGSASCGSESPDDGNVSDGFGNSGLGGTNLDGGSGSGGSAPNPSTGGMTTGGTPTLPSTGGIASGGGPIVPGTGGTTLGGTGGAGTGGAIEPPSGGVAATGGNDEPKSGGSGGTGAGGSETGGAGPEGGTAGGTETGGAGLGGSGQVDCSITVATKSLSAEIPTVGIVEWSTDLPNITEAEIEFGLDTTYGMTAPVDLTEANYRTPILGMKAGGHTYHFRILAKAGDQICTGQDDTLPPTGDPPSALPHLTLTPTTTGGLDGGFLVLETFQQAFGTSGDGAAYIIDADGDFVWWYVVKGFVDLSRARQSYDGKYMWITTVNVMSNTQKMLRVKMDGSEVQDFTQEFGNTHHDFAVRSDETIAFMAYGANCDDIKERSPNGTVTTIINGATALGASACHCNAIQYDRSDDTILFSELDTSSIAKVRRDTHEVVWVMSSQNSAKATVTGLSWVNQHGMHVLDGNRLLFFSNGTGPNSTAIEAELSLNGGSGTANQVWSYPSNITVQYMGDVQRLGNGNTLVTYSTAGEIREVDSSGAMLQTIQVSGSGNLVGFAEKRRSLYGPPPR